MANLYWVQDGLHFSLYESERSGDAVKECTFLDPNITFYGPGAEIVARKWFLETWCHENDVSLINLSPLPKRHPDWPIYTEVMECVEKYMGQFNCRAERWEQFDYPQRLPELRDMVRKHVLREAGDIKSYLRLEKAIDDLGYPGGSNDMPVRIMMEWLQSELDRVSASNSRRFGMAISILAWGKKYTQKMLDYNFKTLLAAGNLPALLKKLPVTIFLQTDRAARKMIEAAPITHKMKALGIQFDYSLIPDEVTASMTNDLITYWMVGAAASIGLHYAKHNGSIFHHSYPDIIYSEKYFSELARLAERHQAILVPGMRSDQSMLMPALSTYDYDGMIAVPSADLIALHMNCLHVVAWPYVVNNRPKKWSFPVSHVMLWESEDAIHFNCPHLDAVWLDFSAIKDLPERYYMSLDSEMDFICKEHNFYIPQEEDDLYRAELSEQGRQATRDLYSDARDAASHMWAVITHRDTLKFFLCGMKCKLNRNIRPMPENVMSNALIAAERCFVYNTMLSIDPYSHIHIARKRFHDGMIYSYVK